MPTRLITASQSASTSSSATGSCTSVCDKSYGGDHLEVATPRVQPRRNMDLVAGHAQPRDQMTAYEAGAAYDRIRIRHPGST